MNTHQNTGVVSAAVSAALATQGVVNAFSFSMLYREPQDMSIASQIAAVNQFWRQQLGSLPLCTIDVRSALVDDCDFEDWLQIFVDCVVPVIVQHQLPKALSAQGELSDF